MIRTPAPEPAPLSFIRKFLLGALAAGTVGTGTELLLLGHFETPAQWIPVAALALTLPVLVWQAVAPGRGSVRTVRVLMCAFLAFGLIGVGLHYDGNVEFERELHPDHAGLTSFQHSVAGATPVLAPGSMLLLGLIGFAHVYRHPSAGGRPRQETSS